MQHLPVVMTKAFNNYVNREKGWTIKAGIHAFLRSEGLCNTLQRKCTDNAARLSSHNNTLKETIGIHDSVLVRKMKLDFEICPSDYTIPSFPYFWDLFKSNLDVQDCIDAPAHLLFLGIARSLYKDIFSMYLSGTKKTKSFVSILNEKLSLLSKAKVTYIAVKEKLVEKT